MLSKLDYSLVSWQVDYQIYIVLWQAILHPTQDPSNPTLVHDCLDIYTQHTTSHKSWIDILKDDI